MVEVILFLNCWALSCSPGCLEKKDCQSNSNMEYLYGSMDNSEHLKETSVKSPKDCTALDPESTSPAATDVTSLCWTLWRCKP